MLLGYRRGLVRSGRNALGTTTRAALLATTALLSLPLLAGAAMAQTIVDGGSVETVPGTQGTPWNIVGGLIVGNISSGTLNVGDGVTAGVVTSSSATLGLSATGSGTVNIRGSGSFWDIGGGSLAIGGAGTGQVTVASGGRLDSDFGIIGNGATSLGAVTITGAGSVWNVGVGLGVGDLGTGLLTIANGGAVNVMAPTQVSVGGSTASGTVMVTGTGSTWTMAGGLALGVGGTGGTGTLTVDNGGVVNTGADAVIGQDSGSQGSASVLGTGAWNVGGVLTVGGGGSGTLDIGDGVNPGVVTSSGGELGQSGNGVVNVNGAGSYWNLNGGNLVVGGGGSGQLTISNGGRVDADFTSIGNLATGVGAITVTGSGSSLWNVTSSLFIGNAGQGQLMITNGGRVDNTSALGSTIGNALNSRGVVVVDGVNSLWSNAGPIAVAFDGQGSLLIQNGGTVTANFVDIGASTNGAGAVSVSGANSLLQIAGDIHVGSLGFGSLAITNGGQVTNDNGVIGNGPGFANIASVTGANSSWINNNQLYVGNGGTGTLQVSNGGLVRAGSAGLGILPGSSGAATVDGANSRLEISSNFHVGYQGDGALTVSNGGTVSVGGVIGIAEQSGSTGKINIGAAATDPAAAPGTIDVQTIFFYGPSSSLVFNHTGTNYAFSPELSGAGLVDVYAGTTILTADSSAFTGATTLHGGKLVVNGSLANATVDVQSGAILGGNGTVGATTVQAGGIVAPGNSVGLLTVNGDLMLSPGSIYAVEIAGNGTSDKIAVSGQATVAGSQIVVTALDPKTSYISGQHYALLNAAGGIVGSFAEPTTQSAFLTLALDQTANAVGLTIQIKEPAAELFQTAARTRNQFSTAVALNTLPQVGGTLALYNSLLQLDAPSARLAFDALSGEIHASAKTALVEESGQLRGAMNDRLRSAFGSVGSPRMATMNYGFTADRAPALKGSMPVLNADRFAVWGQGYGSWGRTDSDGNAARLTRSTGGLLVGADAAVFDTLRFGVIAGYSRSDFDVKNRFSSGESGNYHLGLYGGGQFGALGLRAGASYSWHDIETNRSVAFAGFGDRLKGSYDAGTAQIFGELGYRIDLDRVAFEPFAGLAYVSLRSDGFGETGGAAALTARSQDTGVGYSTLGLRASSRFALQGMDLTLRGALAWRHAFGDTTPLATLAFAGSNAFTVAGVPIARNAALVEAGLDLAISPSATLGVSYSGQLAADAQDHAFKGMLAVKF